MSSKVQARLNEQFNLEYQSSYLYLSMAAYAESLSLVGFARWFRGQAEEELQHAMKFFDYINHRQSRVALGKIEAPKSDFASIQECFKLSLEHEKKVSASINEIYALAGDEKDFATQNFLGWFIGEQVEEEASVVLWLDRLAMINDSKGSLLYLDKMAGKRGSES